ncbi:MAG: FtsQ-type POTRA domain-containing protein [Oscillospiraceae bacterium]|jgi:hypothetical protein|nr:FtsQ-type POTRA domain-containing protein [Oscillospiraceae bacterium]
MNVRELNSKRISKPRTITHKSRKIKKRSHSLALRRIKIVFALIFVMSILAFGIFAAFMAIFKVNKIEVLGNTRYEISEVLEISNLKQGENLFLCDINSAKEKIESKFPYIESAEIKRCIPRKLKIKLEEAVPAGLIENPAYLENSQTNTDEAKTENDLNIESQAKSEKPKYIVISSSRRILEFVDQKISGLPLIKGIDPENAILCSKLKYKNQNISCVMDEITSLFSKNDLNDISTIDLSNLDQLSFQFQDRITVILGDSENLSYKIHTAAHIIKNKINSEEIGTLDLSSIPKNGRSYFKPENDK